MDEFELEQLRQNPQWGVVLELYYQLCQRSREQTPDFDGWVARMHEVPEVPSAELPGIHGKLIAFGFLKFDLSGRDGGIRYQLTPLGKQGISSSVPSADDEASADPSEREEVLSLLR
jgi:hypothetical protein